MTQPSSPLDKAPPGAFSQYPLFDENLPPPVAVEAPEQAIPGKQFSNFVVYVDESGDHSLESIDPQYPVFVLAFCVFQKHYYAHTIVPALETFKFTHFGHDLVVLHETDIRKERGNFRFSSRQHKEYFFNQLTGIIEENNFILIACVVDKARLRERSENPYHLALGFCLETLHEFMQEKSQHEMTTHVVVECRGKKEDAELELEFLRVCAGENKFAKPLPFEVVFADKKTNSSGLQLADLVARPIGLSVVKPGQLNRAFEVLKRKFFCSGGRSKVGVDFEGWGLKIHPTPESERPR